MTDTIPAELEQQAESDRPPFIVIAPYYKDPITGALFVHQDLSEEYSAWSGIQTRFSHCDVPSRLPSSVTLCIYRVVQEALCNAAKHSRASRAMVMLRGIRNGLQIVVKDSGRGFLVDQARAKGRLGLISLTERVRLAGGNCTIRSAPDQGTRVQAWVPLAPSAETLRACAG